MASKTRIKQQTTESSTDDQKPAESPISTVPEAFMTGLRNAGFDPLKESGVVYVKVEKADIKTIDEIFKRMQEIAQTAGYNGSFGAASIKQKG